MAALEFALIAPLLILMGLGAVEYAAAIRVELSTDRAAREVAAMLSQHIYDTTGSYTTTVLTNAAGTTPATTISTIHNVITSAEMQDYGTAGQNCYEGAIGTMTLAAASIDFTNTLNSNGTVITTASLGWDAHTTDNGVPGYVASPYDTLPAKVNEVGLTSLSDGVNNDSVMIVTAVANYTLPFLPTFSEFQKTKTPTSFTFTSSAIVRPRNTPVLQAGW